MPLVATRAVVLQAFPYGETSKILKLLTSEYGVRSVIAKGAMRPRSRFGGTLQPFTEGDAQFVLKEGRELQTLSGFDLTRSRQAIGRDFAAFSGASLLAEVVLRFGTEEPQAEVFAEVARTLDELTSAGEHPAWIAAAGVWRVIALFGYEPQVTHCVHCARPILDTEPSRFDIRAGGVACTVCRPGGRLVPSLARRELRAMIAGSEEAPDLANRGLHRSLLSAFLTVHLSTERPLRSLELFLEELR